ncbi:MAG TPA: transporter substrate-binding domain-containing protein [Rhodocyclaceae bacterium]
MKRLERKVCKAWLRKNITAAAGILRRGLALVALVLPLQPAQAGGLDEIQAAGVIRVCADPHNLPFSDMGLAPAGYDLDIAAEIAKALGVRLDYLWFHTSYEKRVLRQLYEGNCDFFMGLPTSIAESAPRLILTRPYLRVGFVPVVPDDSAATSLADLKGEKIGVEMMTVADFHLFRNGYARDLYRSQEEMFEALQSGRLRAAMMWLPVVDWEIKRHGGAALKLLPIADAAIQFPLAIAVRKEDTDLRERINAVLASLDASGVIAQTLGRYGLENARSIVR